MLCVHELESWLKANSSKLYFKQMSFLLKGRVIVPSTFFLNNRSFTVVYFVAKPLIWSEAEGNLVVIETSI